MSEISVIMPVYNAGKYLSLAIKSILNQTFSDFEFLMCDDCSSDDSNKIMQDFASLDRRIKILKNEQNSGVAVTLNHLLAAATSPLIARMDADDIADPERLAKQYAFMQDNPDIDIAGGQIEIIDEYGETTGKRLYLTDCGKIKADILCRNPLAHPTIIMRSSVIKSIGGYNDICGCEDYDLYLRAVEKGFKLTNMPDILLHYRISSGQVKQRNMKSSLLSTIRLQRKYIFRQKFIPVKALCYFFAEHILLLLPNKILLKLFAFFTFEKKNERSR